MKKAFFLIILSLCSFFVFSAEYSFGFEVSMRYNRAIASQEWGANKQNLYFNQLQIGQELFYQRQIADTFYLGTKLGMLNDSYTSIYKFNEMREKINFFVKLEPMYFLKDKDNSEKYFVFAGLMIGTSLFMDINSDYLSLGFDLGGGMEIFSSVNDKYSALAKCFFTYLRGSYTNEYSIGVGLVNCFR